MSVLDLGSICAVFIIVPRHRRNFSGLLFLNLRVQVWIESHKYPPAFLHKVPHTQSLFVDIIVPTTTPHPVLLSWIIQLPSSLALRFVTTSLFWVSTRLATLVCIFSYRYCIILNLYLKIRFSIWLYLCYVSTTSPVTNRFRKSFFGWLIIP